MAVRCTSCRLAYLIQLKKVDLRLQAVKMWRLLAPRKDELQHIWISPMDSDSQLQYPLQKPTFAGHGTKLFIIIRYFKKCVCS